jgi:hypothetical protein
MTHTILTCDFCPTEFRMFGVVTRARLRRESDARGWHYRHFQTYCPECFAKLVTT